MVEMTRSLDVGGCLLRFADRDGGGRGVMLLHGAGVDHAMFDAQYRALADAGFHPVTVDLRGHGLSRPTATPLTADLLADDIEALVGHLGLDRPVLVGLSLGGNLAQHLVHRAPDRYAALAVLDATWNTGPLTALERTALKAAAPLLGVIPAGSLPSLMAKASATTEAARADLRRAFAQLTKREFLAAWEATTQFVDPEPGWRTPIPLLLVRGAEDRTGNIADAMPRWAAAEGIAEHVVAGAGHVVSQDAPEAVTTLLLDFLDTLR